MHIKSLGIVFLLVSNLMLVGCGSGSTDSTQIINNNQITYAYNVRNFATTDYSANLSLSYSNGATGTMSLSRIYTGDAIINGIPVKNMHVTTTTVVNGTTNTTRADAKYDVNGIAVEIVDNNVTCTLQNTPTPLPIAGVVGESSSVAAEYICTDGTSRTERWSLSDAGNGNASLTFTSTEYDSGNNLSYAVKEKSTMNANSVITYLNYDIDLVSLGLTATASGPVQLQ